MRLLEVLEAGPGSLPELERATGLPKATAHRLVSALEDHGLVRRDSAGRFTLGLRLVALGRAAASSLPLAEAAEPAMAGLRDLTGESVQLYVVDGQHRMCLVSLDSPRELRTIVPPGARLPLDRGSGGRVLTGETSATGWLESVSEREQGVASVSAPVTDREGRLVASLSVSGPVDRLGDSPGALHGAAVLEAADSLSRLLGAAVLRS